MFILFYLLVNGMILISAIDKWLTIVHRDFMELSVIKTVRIQITVNVVLRHVTVPNKNATTYSVV